MPITTREQVIAKIKNNRRALKRYGVKSLAVFGSAARNKMRGKSDVDILVQFDKSTWANYIGLKFFLEDLLGRKTPNALKPVAKPFMERDLYHISI
ncbi:MAG: DNA polymerase subunit beta [Chloroflexi bacterium]|nr:DNA polymerase subunit beta [Chloroflexi bacterium CFX1]MCK6566331.1 nucleotidyltransferase domain-containing protein [Anaerolineales bacterium]MCQ3952397.1 DNA polymerase subunit beta [Chloroflexota bacterium]MDL1917991.1 DNA polymerase subunit beta [Chloroflexi bacterium CFX5]NUQ59342.1 nucleotidyltransferase domain-containing protein [Anaerolineales bacterium]